jgi:hypothetical protein
METPNPDQTQRTQRRVKFKRVKNTKVTADLFAKLWVPLSSLSLGKPEFKSMIAAE